MLKMVGESSAQLTRNKLREEIADFIVARIQQRWFQEVMAACQEVTWEAVQELHELQQCVSEAELVAPLMVAPAVAEAAEDVRALPPHAICDELLRAITWHTNVKEESVLIIIAEGLAPAEREAMLAQYENRDTQVAVARDAAKILVHPHLSRSRMQVAAFDPYL